jgi:hypothetical protein
MLIRKKPEWQTNRQFTIERTLQRGLTKEVETIF